MSHRESGHVICLGRPPWCGVTRARAKALGIKTRKLHNIGRSPGRLPSHPDPPNIGVAFISEFLSWNRDFPGSFPGSSISAHVLTLQPDPENRITKPRLFPIVLPSFLLPQIPIPCTLRQVVGIQRCKAPGPSCQLFSDYSRQAN